MTFSEKLSESIYFLSFFGIGVPIFLISCAFILCLFGCVLTRENFSFEDLIHEFFLLFKDENGNIHFAIKRLAKAYFVFVFIFFILSLF